MPQQAFERVGPAGGQRDARDVSLALVARQPGQLRIDHRFLALHDIHRHLAPPLADLDDERDVVPDRHVLEDELPGRVGRRIDNRITRQRRVAAVAAGPVHEHLDLGVGHVHHRVVERQLEGWIPRAGRRVDRPAQRRGRAAGALDLLALEPCAARAAGIAAAVAGVASVAGVTPGVPSAVAAAIVVSTTTEGARERERHQRASREDRPTSLFHRFPPQRRPRGTSAQLAAVTRPDSAPPPSCSTAGPAADRLDRSRGRCSSRCRSSRLRSD